MKLIVQPTHGSGPLVEAVNKAKKSVMIVVFRFDLPELRKALERAVARGIAVRAVVADKNRGGVKKLRKFESAMLAAGITLDRTDDDKVRYHGKLLLIDRKTLFVLGFNYTHKDIRESRSLGVSLRNRSIVQEAMRLIEADANRQPFQPARTDLVVSPENARPRLESFLRGARKQILIYDPKVSDTAMIKVLKKRARAGVEVRILGKLQKRWHGDDIEVQDCPVRLHVRAIVRDGRRAFVGSQSLRRLELDVRREVGVFIRDMKIVRQIQQVFKRDWNRR